MTFSQWITSSYPNPSINGQWGMRHIIVLIGCIATIIALALIFRKRSEKSKKIVLWTLVGLILFFEIARRVINFYKMSDPTVNNVLYTLLPRPWCAISCWALIISAIFNKKFLYNAASTTSLLCAIIFFAYPGAGFNNQYVLFENLYSIGTHSLLLVTSITLITLKFTKFEFRPAWKELVCLAVIFIYAFIEIYLLKIASDPLYFMPNNDIQGILGTGYGLFLVIYIVFITIYFSLFYLIQDRKKIFKKRPKR